MSFASILSEPALNNHDVSMSPTTAKTARKTSISQKPSHTKVEKMKEPVLDIKLSPAANYATSNFTSDGQLRTNGYTPALPNPRRVLTARENEKVAKALADIDEAMLSDVDSLGFDIERKRYAAKSRKRALEVDEVETVTRKVWVRIHKLWTS